MRRISFTPLAFEEYTDWSIENKIIYKKIIELLKATSRDPFDGIGKPEKLSGDYKGKYSRRITEEHRLVYTVTDDEIIIFSCKYHYPKK